MMKLADNLFLYSFGELDGPFNCEHLNNKDVRDCGKTCWSIVTESEMKPRRALMAGTALCDEHVKNLQVKDNERANTKNNQGFRCFALYARKDEDK